MTLFIQPFEKRKENSPQNLLSPCLTGLQSGTPLTVTVPGKEKGQKEIDALLSDRNLFFY